MGDLDRGFLHLTTVLLKPKEGSEEEKSRVGRRVEE
jgi:hypothetical protein